MTKFFSKSNSFVFHCRVTVTLFKVTHPKHNTESVSTATVRCVLGGLRLISPRKCFVDSLSFYGEETKYLD